MSKGSAKRQRRAHKPKELVWAKPVPLHFFQKVLAECKLSPVELAVYVYGLLRSNKKGEFFLVRQDVEKSVGHIIGEVSTAVTSLCGWKLFARTGRFRRRKYPILQVILPREKNRFPVPLGLRDVIHQLSPSALRLLLVYIIRGGWTPLGCVLKYASPEDFAVEAGLSRTSAFDAANELRENGWTVLGILQGELRRKFKTWDGVTLVTKKAGFVEPPLVESWKRHNYIFLMTRNEPYNDFDLRDRQLWRSLQSILNSAVSS
jgi:hypothetical protein